MYLQWTCFIRLFYASTNQVIKPRQFECFISHLADMESHDMHTQEQIGFLSVEDFLSFWDRAPAFPLLHLSFYTDERRTVCNSILLSLLEKYYFMSKMTLTVSVIITDDQSHVCAWWERYESFVSAFTLHLKQTSRESHHCFYILLCFLSLGAIIHDLVYQHCWWSPFWFFWSV